MKYQILTGNNCDVLRQFPDNHFDSIVTDPPYGIDFLGKAWDANTGALETYQECLRVLKPGGHILAFSAARTYHHLAITLEQAGFEIRDQIMWIYSSGFPKSQDIGKSIERSEGKKKKKVVADRYEGSNEVIEGSFGSGHGKCSKCKKDVVAARILGQRQACPEDGCEYNEMYKPADNAWAGWGTQLKPAHEPIALARKPIKLSIARNCQTHGVGALNIDATRIQGLTEKELNWTPQRQQAGDNTEIGTFGASGLIGQEVSMFNDKGRFPSNVIGEIPDYQKYFYCPKVSRAERHIGFDDPGPLFPGMSRVEVNMGGLTNSSDKNKTNTRGDVEKRGIKTHWQMAEEMGGSLVDHEGNPTRSGNKALIPGVGDIYTHSLSKKYEDWCKQNNKPMPNSGNNHPTVKPIELMKYLIKLVTPPGGTVLDPFNGSGSTGCAAVELGYDYTGIELDLKYVDIARKRIQAWYEHTHPTDPLVASGLFEQ